MSHQRPLAAVVLTLALPLIALGAVRERANFDAGWRFQKGDHAGAERAAFDDSSWRKLNVPHDWSIEGPYSPSNAACTAFLPGGIGWYRKSFSLDDASRGRRVFLEFDGVYRNSDVWINGHHLGHRPYGYSSFEYELTPYVNFGARPNVVAVRVDHSESADSRWYTGSGIYRNVWLVTTEPLHVDHWGTYVYTPVVKPAEALVTIETTAVNQSQQPAAMRLVTSVVDAAGKEVGRATSERELAAGATATVIQQTAVANPELWSLDTPTLYTAVTRIYAGDNLSDEYRTPFGIRTIRFDPNLGFFLNGKPMKFKGVCIHHDLGALGAAFDEATLERRLRLLKAIGVNAIRGSHNPQAPEFYELCDRLGLMVMDEAFDEWTAGKHKWIEGWNKGKPGLDGYHEIFDQWSKRDIQDMVRRDRNHPSIVLWSIGNEIDYPGDPFGHPRGHNGLRPGMLDGNVLPSIARGLISDIKALDGTRPVTQALADIDASNATGLANLLGVAGYNYLEQHYAADHAVYPERIILGSENYHSLDAWRAVADKQYVIGQFLWTGVDYLGEARAYPARGSTSGLLDLCGFRKPLSYLREALWSSRPMVYAAAHEATAQRGPRTDFENGPARGRLVESWNWQGDARKTIPVEVYTNCESAELFLNGRSLGEKKVADPLDPVLRWDVPDDPGTVRVVGKRAGLERAHFELTTAGPADHLEILPDGDNVEIRVVDAAGHRVVNARQPISVKVEGGESVALDSGDIRDLTPVDAGHRNAYEGRILAIVRGSGSVVMHATAPGLKAATNSFTLPTKAK